MSDIDPASVKSAHAQHCTDGHGGCLYVGGWNPNNKPPCEPYRLAEALAEVQAIVRDGSLRVLDRAREAELALAASEAKVARAMALPSYVDEDRLAWVDANDLRAALADHPEQS